jgi:PAS fold
MVSAELVDRITRSGWFNAWAPYLVVDTGLRIRAVNRAYEDATGQPRSALVGEHLFEAFPDNPADPGADGVANLSRSLESVFTHGAPDWMGVQRYDVPDVDAGSFVPKLWAPVNSPILEHGRTVGALHHVEDVTEVADVVGRAGAGITLAARRLWQRVPGLSFEAVVGVLAQCHRVVTEVLDERRAERAEEMAMIRLEVLAADRPPGAGADVAAQAVALWLTLLSCRPGLDDESAEAIAQVMHSLDLMASSCHLLDHDDQEALLEHLREADALAQAIYLHVRQCRPDGRRA